jgi:hypothetical protein
MRSIFLLACFSMKTVHVSSLFWSLKIEFEEKSMRHLLVEAYTLQMMPLHPMRPMPSCSRWGILPRPSRRAHLHLWCLPLRENYVRSSLISQDWILFKRCVMLYSILD